MRGRDIKQGSYEWAGLYLISTFPSLHINISEYPAVKEYLSSGKWSDEDIGGHGMDKLRQDGQTFTINGRVLKTRKKTGNKWFETQDQIAYKDDFDKQKIIYREISEEMTSVLDNDNFLINNKCYFICGEKLKYLQSFFMSSIFKIILMQANTTGGRGADFMENIKVFYPEKDEPMTDDDFCKIYGLTDEEMSEISSSVK